MHFSPTKLAAAILRGVPKMQGTDGPGCWDLETQLSFPRVNGFGLCILHFVSVLEGL